MLNTAKGLATAYGLNCHAVFEHDLAFRPCISDEISKEFGNKRIFLKLMFYSR